MNIDKSIDKQLKIGKRLLEQAKKGKIKRESAGLKIEDHKAELKKLTESNKKLSKVIDRLIQLKLKRDLEMLEILSNLPKDKDEHGLPETEIMSYKKIISTVLSEYLSNDHKLQELYESVKEDDELANLKLDKFKEVLSNDTILTELHKSLGKKYQGIMKAIWKKLTSNLKELKKNQVIQVDTKPSGSSEYTKNKYQYITDKLHELGRTSDQLPRGVINQLYAYVADFYPELNWQSVRRIARKNITPTPLQKPKK